MSCADIVQRAIFSLAVATLPILLPSPDGCAAEATSKAEDVAVTPSLVREIQFMLLRIGMEPGPIDGVIGPQTTRAWGKFEQDTGLPQIELVNAGKISATALARLRGEASRVIFEGEKRPETPPPRRPRLRRRRSRRHSKMRGRPTASPPVRCMPKTLRSGARNTLRKNICRMASTAQQRGQWRC